MTGEARTAKTRAKATLRRVALNSVKTVAGLGDRLAPPPPGVVVLIYHRVGARVTSEIDMPSALFARQMEWLADRGRAATLDDALAALTATTRPVPDPVVVTFDDGTADFADEVVPVLQRFNVPATLYVATDFVERGIAFPADGHPVSWSALADAASTGLVTIGSHTHTHALLDRLPADEVAEELDRSVGLIGDRLGLAARHFAYPKAVAGSAAADAAIRERFASAALAGTRPNAYGATDPFALARSPIQVADAMRWFEAKVEGGMALEDGLRRTLNRGRYAGATT